MSSRSPPIAVWRRDEWDGNDANVVPLWVAVSAWRMTDQIAAMRTKNIMASGNPFGGGDMLTSSSFRITKRSISAPKRRMSTLVMCQNTAATSGRHKHREMVSVVEAGRRRACNLQLRLELCNAACLGIRARLRGIELSLWGHLGWPTGQWKKWRTNGNINCK